MRWPFQRRVCRPPGRPRPSANRRSRERTSRLNVLMADFTRDVVSLHGRQVLTPDQFNPGQLFLRKNISRRSKVFRMVEARGRDINFVRTIGMLISKRTPAAAAECPPRTGFRAVPVWSSLVEAKARTLYCNPRDRLGPNGTATVFAMAICLVERFRVGAKTHFSTVAAAIDGRVFHRCRTESTATGADARLMIVHERSARV